MNADINSLPNELLIHILSFCDPKTIGACEQVSKEFQELANDPMLWKIILNSYGIEKNE